MEWPGVRPYVASGEPLTPAGEETGSAAAAPAAHDTGGKWREALVGSHLDAPQVRRDRDARSHLGEVDTVISARLTLGEVDL